MSHFVVLVECDGHMGWLHTPENNINTFNSIEDAEQAILDHKETANVLTRYHVVFYKRRYQIQLETCRKLIATGTGEEIK